MGLIARQDVGTTDSEDFITVARRYILSVESAFPQFIDAQNAGAETEEIEDAENIMGFKLPPDLIKLYSVIDGDNYEFGGLMLGLNLFACDEMAETYNQLLPLADIKKDISSVPERAVKSNVFNPKWIPFAGDGESAYLAIDLDPDSDGTYGQIINIGENETQHTVVGVSLRDFIISATQKISQMDIDLLPDGGCNMRQKDKIHTIDWLLSQKRN